MLNKEIMNGYHTICYYVENLVNNKNGSEIEMIKTMIMTYFFISRKHGNRIELLTC